MKLRHIYIGYLLVGLSLSSYLRSHAQQRADTLRRNLTVLTSEIIELEERMPEKHSFIIDKPNPMTSLRLKPSPLLQISGGLEPPIFLGIDSLQPMPPLRPALGYASANIGLAYNAHISAGIRPINTESRQLDLHLAAVWSKYKYFHTPSLPQTIAHSALRLGAGYKQRLQTLNYKVQSSYYTDSYPSLGIENHTATSSRTSNSSTNTLAPNIRSNLFRLSGEITSPNKEQKWLYELRPKLAVASRGEAQDIELELGGQLTYLLEQSSLNISSELNFWNCNPIIQNRYTLSYLSLRPSWRMDREEDRWGWHTDLGAKVALGSREARKVGLMLSPYISAGLNYADWIKLSLNLDGGISGRRLSDVIDTAPWLRITSPEALTHTPWQSRLELELLPFSNLSIGLSGSFSRHRWAEGIATSLDGQAVLGHKRYYEDANHWTLGGTFRYRAKHYIEAQITATYQHWQTDSGESYLGGHPRLHFSTQLTFTPYEAFSLDLGYDLMGDYRYRIVEEHKPYSLDAVGLLIATASYRLTSQLSLLGYAHYITTPQASRVIGFPTERLRATMGVNWIF